MNIRSEIAIKMLMNAHSTAVMTKMGRVVGNTMSNVRAGNLKLIGRATYLVKMHVGDVILRGSQKLGLQEDAKK
jgi:N-acetylmuramic acid 6-phosphate etherase